MDERNGNANGYVTWRQLVALGLPALAIPIVVFWVVLTNHAQQPHNGAVRVHQMESVENQLREIRTAIRAVELQMNQLVRFYGPRRDTGSNPASPK